MKRKRPRKPGSGGYRPGAGAPPLYKLEYCEQARKICALGAVDVQIADFFNVTVPTIYNWRHRYPEFEEACRAGKEVCDRRVERSLYERAVGLWVDEEKVYCFWDPNGKKVVEHRTKIRKHYPADPRAARFWLAHRKPAEWGDVTSRQY